MHYNTSRSRHNMQFANFRCHVYYIVYIIGKLMMKRRFNLCTISCVHAYLVTDTSFQITSAVCWLTQYYLVEYQSITALFSACVAYMMISTVKFMEIKARCFLPIWSAMLLSCQKFVFKSVWGLWLDSYRQSSLCATPFFRLKMEFNYRPIIK